MLNLDLEYLISKAPFQTTGPPLCTIMTIIDAYAWHIMTIAETKMYKKLHFRTFLMIYSGKFRPKLFDLFDRFSDQKRIK